MALLIDLIGLLTILLAICCAPYMVAKWAGVALPSPRRMGSAIAPVVALGWYYLKPFIFHGYKQAPDSRPRLSIVSAADSVEADEIAPDDADRQQTDLAFALIAAFESKELDRTRAVIIDIAVRYGWNVGGIRGLVKGDSGAVGAEVATARERLGLKEPARTIPMRDSNGTREVRI